LSKKFCIWIMALAGIISGEGCTVKYSFTGATIAPEVKSISVQYFPNRAATVLPNLAQDFTNALMDRCKAQTGLTFTNDMGDVNFEGEITDYKIEPVAITGNEMAAMNRLSISVRVKFTNRVEPEWDFETTFTRYAEYESTMDPTQAQDEYTPQIIDQLTEDIFNRAFVNW